MVRVLFFFRQRHFVEIPDELWHSRDLHVDKTEIRQQPANLGHVKIGFTTTFSISTLVCNWLISGWDAQHDPIQNYTCKLDMVVWLPLYFQILRAIHFDLIYNRTNPYFFFYFHWWNQETVIRSSFPYRTTMSGAFFSQSC